jgi:hypothetical protein
VAGRTKKDGKALTPMGPLTPAGALAAPGPRTPANAAGTRGRRSPLLWIGAVLLLALAALAVVFVLPGLRGGPGAPPAAPTAALAQATAISATATDLPTDEPTAAPVEATSTPAAIAALASDTPTPTATPADVPVASFVSPFDGAVLPTSRPVEIVLAASDAAGLDSLTLAIDGQPFTTYRINGEKLYARTLTWEAPAEAGEVVFAVSAVNVDGVRGEPQSITVAFVDAEGDEATPTDVPPTARATAAPAGAATAAITAPAATIASAAATPTAPPATTPVAYTLLTFEAFGAWQIGDQPNGAFTQTSEQSRSGFAAKYEYDFPGSGENFVVFRQARDIAGTPNALHLWVYGDGSGHFLNVWIIDNEGQVWSVPFGRIQHSGWQQMTGLIDTDQGWPWGHINGPNNGEVDYPIGFSAFVLDADNDFVGQGAIYLDDLSVDNVD